VQHNSTKEAEMGLFGAGKNAQGNSVAREQRRTKAISQASAAKAAGRGSRKIRAAVPAKTKRGW
jgi:hypothetical protein